MRPAVLLVLAVALAAAEPPTLAVPRLDQPPRIDGRVDPGEWVAAACNKAFFAHGLGWRPAPGWMRSEVRIGFDAEHLHLLVRGAMPDGLAPVARCRLDDDPRIFADDHLEVQILAGSDPAAARATGFVKLVVNAAGAVLDQRISGPAQTVDDAWDSGASARSGQQDGDWILELAIPVQALGGDLAGRSLVIQVVRDGGDGVGYAGWGPGSWMQWERFPVLRCAAAGQASNIPAATTVEAADPAAEDALRRMWTARLRRGDPQLARQDAAAVLAPAAAAAEAALRADDRPGALRSARSGLQLLPGAPAGQLLLASVQARLGETEAALAALEAAADAGGSADIAADPAFAGLRGHLRFQAVSQRLHR